MTTGKKVTLKEMVELINNAEPITEDDFRTVLDSVTITPVEPPEGKQGVYFRVRKKL